MYSGDEGVMHTNDDATTCKRYAVKLGYWNDPFIENFFPSRNLNRFERKTPEINRGYYARFQTFDCLLEQFFFVVDNYNKSLKGIKDDAPLKCQIINLGAGYDTLFWRLKCLKKIDFIKAFVDVDLIGITAKKLHHIKTKPELLKVLGENVEFTQHDLHSSEYHLVTADLRNLDEFIEKVYNNCNLDKDTPTFIISECVLVYLNKEHTNKFINWASKSFTHCVITNYQQVNMFDRFGEIMNENLKLRDCELLDLESCRNLEVQRNKFVDNGFKYANSWDMLTVYNKHLDRFDKERIEKIEFLDEQNLLDQLLSHYSITVAFNGFRNFIEEDEKFGF